MNQTLNFDNDSFIKPKLDPENSDKSPNLGESIANLSVIHFKGDQSSMKMPTPVMPMLKTIKSELEEDYEHDDFGDEDGTIDM
jgi:hypothetical protein